ncbi:MAG: hypothetical protein QXO40_03875 [Candidatus Aenigmatarchaeota archaeon]
MKDKFKRLYKKLISEQFESTKRLREIWKEVKAMLSTTHDKIIEFIDLANAEGFTKEEIDEFLSEELNLSELELRRYWKEYSERF